MVAALEEIINSGDVEEKITPQAHTFRFAFSVLNLVHGEPCIYKKDIQTRCDVLPTTWSLKMKFEKDLDSNTPSCTLTAGRTDNIDAIVNADIETSYGFVEYPSCQLEQLFREEYSAGHEIERYSENILPFQEESEKYLDGGITVEVTLTIRK